MNPPRFRLRKSEQIDQVLKRVVKQDQIREQAKLADVSAAWLELLGDLGRHTRVQALRSGTLHVAVDSPTALYELRQFHEGRLLEELGKRFPKRVFRRVKAIVKTKGSDDE